MIPLAGFLPDVDPATPGAITSAYNVVPFASGMKGAPSLAAITDAPALAAACLGGVVAAKLDGTRRIFAGTASTLYELNTGTIAWDDVSRGGAYSLVTGDRWKFVQFGDSTIATNKSTTLQRSNGSGAFADISGAPKAKCIVAASDFVVAFNTDDGTYGNSYDRWWCCGLRDETTWTPSLSTQANTGRLVSVPGEITAALEFGSQIVAYKERGMYLGTYVGTPEVWQWTRIPGDVGCVGPDAVCDIGSTHIFVGRSDIFAFDGTRPISIAENQVRQWFFNNVSQVYLQNTQVVHDKQNGTIWIFYPSTSSAGSPNAALVYHIGTKRWGVATLSIETALNYVSSGATIDGMGGTIDEIEIPYDSQYWLAGGRMLAVFDTSHQPSALSGVAGTSQMMLWDIGDDQKVGRLKRVRIAYQSDPSSSTITGYYKMARGMTLSNGGSGIYSAGKYDLRQTGRFHRVMIQNEGDWSTAEADFDIDFSGNR